MCQNVFDIVGNQAYSQFPLMSATDDLSVSYEIEKSEVSRLDDTTTEQQSKAIQLAYTMGGMTLAVSHASHDNNGYVLDANTEQTLFAVTMAF